MNFIEGYGSHGDDFSARIEQHPEHLKYCVQVTRRGERAEWFGWSDNLITAQEWVNKKLKEFEKSC